jgi:tetratricopeptide (TPR) repeat protein
LLRLSGPAPAEGARRESSANRSKAREKYTSVGEFGKAIIGYKNARRVDPRSAELNFKLGQAHASDGQPREAFLPYTEAIDSEPNYAPARIAQGKRYLAAKRPRLPRLSSPRSPDNIDARIFLPDASLAGKNLPESIKGVNRILQPHPAPISNSARSTPTGQAG